MSIEQGPEAGGEGDLGSCVGDQPPKVLQEADSTIAFRDLFGLDRCLDLCADFVLAANQRSQIGSASFRLLAGLPGRLFSSLLLLLGDHLRGCE